MSKPKSAIVTRQLAQRRLGTLHKPSRRDVPETFGNASSPSPVAEPQAAASNTGAPMEWLIDGDNTFVPPVPKGETQGDTVQTIGGFTPVNSRTGKVPDYLETGLDCD